MALVAGRSGSVQRIPENRSITLLSGQRAALAQCTQRPRVLSSEAEPRQRALGDREAAAHDGSQGCCPAGWSQSVPLAADSSGAVRVSDGHLLPLARLWSGLQEYLYLPCSPHRCFVCDSVLNSEHGSSPLPASLDTSAPAHTVHSTPDRTRCVLAAGCDGGATARSAASPAQLDASSWSTMPGPNARCETGLAQAQWRSAQPIATMHQEGPTLR